MHSHNGRWVGVITAIAILLGGGMAALADGTPVLEFYGSDGDSYIELGTPTELQIADNAPFTIEGWMAFKALSSRDMLYSKSNARNGGGPYDYLLGFANNTLAAYDGTWQGNFSVSRELNRWYHVAFSFNGTTMSYYLDGALLGTSDFSFANTPGNIIKIGGYYPAADVDGFKSDVRVWSTARSQVEIQDNMNQRLAGTETSLIGYWPLNEGSGTNATDATASANDGEIINATWTNTPDLDLGDAGFYWAAPSTLADKQTGSTEFTNSNTVDIVAFPVPDGYDQYQVTEQGEVSAIDPNGWGPTNSLPSQWTFAQPADDTNVTLYAWFTNETASVELRRGTGEIVYTTAAPLPAVHAGLTRETAGFTLRMVVGDLDSGSTGGTFEEQDIPLLSLEPVYLGTPANDLTPSEPFVTLPATPGNYSLGLRAVNAAGNIATSTVCTVTVSETSDLPAGDRYVAVGNLNAQSPFDSWAHAAAHIQDGVNAATAGETVWVHAGRYTVPTNAVDYGGTNVVYLDTLVALRGASGNPADVIIDGEGQHRGMAVVHGASSSDALVLDALTVSNGVAALLGGGIRFVPGAWNGMVQNCVIADNLASGTNTADIARGGGIYGSTSAGWHITVSNCVIRSNFATNIPAQSSAQGGGLWISSGGTKLITHSLLEGNAASIQGGGSYLHGGALSSRRIESCVYRNNRTLKSENAMSGGGAHNNTAEFRNCLFEGNRSANTGAAIFNDRQGLLRLFNCTFTRNGGNTINIRRQRPSDMLEMYNTIAYDNTGNDVNSAADTNYVYNSCIDVANFTGEVIGSGYITNAPLFVDADAGNFRLTSTSPCRDAGMNQLWMAGALDLDGNRRVDSGTVDIGAYEYITYGTLIIVR